LNEGVHLHMFRRKKSFLRDISKYLFALTGLIGAILTVFLISSYIILKNEIEESSNALLNLYINEFENTTSKLDNYFTSLVIQKEELAKLKSSNEQVRMLSSKSLHNYMQDLITNNEIADIIVVYDEEYKVCLDVIKRGFDYEQKNQLRDYTAAAVNSEKKSNKWNLLSYEDEFYLYKMLINDERVIAIYVKTDQLMDYLDTIDSETRTIQLANNDGFIGKVWGQDNLGADSENTIENIHIKDYYTVSQSIKNTDLIMYSFTKKNSIFKQVSISTVFVSIVVIATFGFLLVFLRYVRKMIFFPMQVIIEELKLIKEGKYEHRIQGDFKTEEFELLQEATNKMIDEIMGLKINSYEKKIELQDAELKNIRLQLRPHFFLNALTTVSGLSLKGNNTLINEYVKALAKHIRYMFKIGMKTVPIKDEIKHVINYMEIQELKYPECVFHMIDLPEELENWMIPQMIIHTFVENIYKYAISIDEIITLLIKVSKVQRDHQEMLLIEIEDDGHGYPQEVIDYMNNAEGQIRNEEYGIGLWSVKRMMELMYEKDNLVIISNVQPHGCSSKVYIPKNSKHGEEKDVL